MTATSAALATLVVPLPGRQFDRWDLDYWEWHIGPRRQARGCFLIIDRNILNYLSRASLSTLLAPRHARAFKDSRRGVSSRSTRFWPHERPKPR
jgi:hypothetical protein